MAHASALSSTRIVADEMIAQQANEQEEAAVRAQTDQDIVAALTERFRNAPNGAISPIDNYSTLGSTAAMIRRADTLRVRLYALGDHLRASDLSTGVLVNLSASLSWGAMKAVLLNELYGESIRISAINLDDVSLRLLPDGERIKGPEFVSANDKIMLYIGRAALGGDISDPVNVEAFKNDMSLYMNRYRREGIGSMRRRSSMQLLGMSSRSRLDRSLQSNQSFVRNLAYSNSGRRDQAAGQSTSSGVHCQPRLRQAQQPLDPDAKLISLQESGSGSTGELKERAPASGSASAGGVPGSGQGSAARMEAPQMTLHDAARRGLLTQPQTSAAKPCLALQPKASIDDMPEVVAVDGHDTDVEADDDDDKTHDDEDADPSRGIGGAQTDAAEGTARKAAIREKLRRGVRRLVMLHKLEQLPHAAEASRRNGLSRGRSQARVNWRRSLAAGLFAGKPEKSMDALIREQSNIYQYNDLRKGAKDDSLPFLVLHPDSFFHLSWDVMMLGFVVFFGFMVPYRIGFDIQLSPVDEAFDFAADVLFLVDIVINFRTAYKDDGVLVTDARAMALHYATSWFLIDFVASFPIGWFTDTGGVNKIIRMLRLFKLFRMLRLLRLFPRFTRVLEASIKFNPSMIRFLRSFAIMFLMWHNIGCTYWFVASEELNGIGYCPKEYGGRKCYVNHCVCDLNDPTGSVVILPNTNTKWLDANNPDEWVPHYSLSSASISLQYAQAVFWAVEVTTGIGDDIVPKSQLEVFFTGFMVIVGLMMYSLIIGSASSALANIDSTATQRRQTLEKVNNFMRSRKVPPFFQRIIVDFYEHMWQTPQREADVFRDLPPSLRSRLAIVMNRDLIDRIPIFKLMSASVYVRIVQRLHHNTFLPGEYVIKQGTESDYIYFVKRGKCDALLPNTEHAIYMTLLPGDVFGEQGVVFEERSEGSFRAVDFLDVLMMNEMDYHELAAMAPAFVNELRRVAATRARKRLAFELDLLRRSKRQKNPRGVLAFLQGIATAGGTQNAQAEAVADEWRKSTASAKVAPAPTGTKDSILSADSITRETPRGGHTIVVSAPAPAASKSSSSLPPYSSHPRPQQEQEQQRQGRKAGTQHRMAMPSSSSSRIGGVGPRPLVGSEDDGVTPLTPSNLDGSKRSIGSQGASRRSVTSSTGSGTDAGPEHRPPRRAVTAWGQHHNSSRMV